MNPINKKTILHKKKTVMIVTCFLFIVVLTALIGCSGSYGRLKPSLEIDKMFEENKILSDYSYYYSGSDVKPNAIIAIDNNYALQSSLWKPVDLTTEQLRYWVDFMTNHRGYTLSNYGAIILDPSGKRLGIWYSPWDWTTVKMAGDKNIVVHTPEVNQSRRAEGSFWGILGED